PLPPPTPGRPRSRQPHRDHPRHRHHERRRHHRRHRPRRRLHPHRPRLPLRPHGRRPPRRGPHHRNPHRTNRPHHETPPSPLHRRTRTKARHPTTTTHTPNLTDRQADRRPSAVCQRSVSGCSAADDDGRAAGTGRHRHSVHALITQP